MVKNGQKFMFIKDHRGSINLVVHSETGEIFQKLRYSDWGEVLEDTNPGFQPFGFAGGLYDSDTKLVRFGARDYDPEIGRWLSKDPIRFKGRDTNLYGYVSQNPINLLDPKGKFGVAQTVWSGGYGGGVGGTFGGGVASIGIALMGGKSLTQEEVKGDFETAQDDFIDELIEEGVDDFEVASNGTIIGELEDGTKINVRDHSSDGSPTIEYQYPNGKRHKKRYRADSCPVK